MTMHIRRSMPSEYNDEGAVTGYRFVLLCGAVHGPGVASAGPGLEHLADCTDCQRAWSAERHPSRATPSAD